MIDYHMHSERSGDCSASMISVCDAAIAGGLTEVCFTEHIDFEPTDLCYGKFDYSAYIAQGRQVQKAFAGRLTVRLGVEVDYQDCFRSKISEFLQGREFDYILGAAHYVDGVILEDHTKYFPGKTPNGAYEPFFDNALAAAQTGWFDALAHLDLCKRYGVLYFGEFDPTPYWERINQVLETVIGSGMSLEINTSGLRQNPRDCYPAREILELYRELGGTRITVGSDAHRAEDVGAGVTTALAMARSLGFEHVDTFSRRERIIRPIEEL